MATLLCFIHVFLLPVSEPAVLAHAVICCQPLLPRAVSLVGELARPRICLASFDFAAIDVTSQLGGMLVEE